MNRLSRSLRFKLAATFAVFGVAVTVLLSAGLFVAAHNLGLRLMDETMSSEIDDFLARRQFNPQALLPATVTLRGYSYLPGAKRKKVPEELAALDVGKYQMQINNVPYRIMVVDRLGERFVMMYNASTQQRRENTFREYVMVSTLVMVLLSAWIGWWLAGWIVSPIAELTRRVGNANPEQDAPDISLGFSEDEVGLLAQVFGNYLKRLKAFIERERAFTADVSHELRTPLAVVQGVVELMGEDRHLDGKQHERIARIGRANREMIEMSAALLLMAREENRDEPVMQQCDVWDVVVSAVEMYRHLLSQNTRLELNCASLVHIAAERTLLGIVVSNLIRNAFAYTPSGSVSITLDGGGLTIADTGTGISSEDISRVFNRHFKGAGSAGEGIGLSLVRRICERYGWQTVIESEVGIGTTARLVFKKPAA